MGWDTRRNVGGQSFRRAKAYEAHGGVARGLGLLFWRPGSVRSERCGINKLEFAGCADEGSLKDTPSLVKDWYRRSQETTISDDGEECVCVRHCSKIYICSGFLSRDNVTADGISADDNG